MDLSHLDAIELRLSHERARLAECKESEKAIRQHNVDMIMKERKAELYFLGITVDTLDMNDDELFAALFCK